ncbi:hypothetical protein P5V93_23595 [Mycobacteroides abscessus subsp. abscessus]|uniref:hypothetical protein n=1 Tax=Mycobacteroides abscessus TaxID=36809 RepID=UPI0002EE2B27|nr:hypothetical protein [Mycobacteroides abscessus]MDO3101106.1 hypothetical protein [Mycobacteroides abscessus subsp. abscessus]MDO3185069.1 hypothetical protein [Mycobacteroides abscessus subsp. abscessus]MDO3194307.1 hypothetical protein [Mycobacteroides abscessus subsp. abscessus]MDO3287498.1 hypothetical protein [Mycobacteroides abscessus subsp. abscessus]OLT84781.1 hypothetical protein BKG58_16110 [Mycobacteroides abscessus subsp. abscessus]
MGFKIDPNFQRKIDREVQKKLDKLARKYAHQPVATIEAALKREGIDESQAKTLAAAISEGRPIKVGK